MHDDLDIILSSLNENVNIEFKEWRNSPSVLGDLNNTKCLYGYCVALGNQGGGHLYVGITDKVPREVVGTNAFLDTSSVKSQIYRKLGAKIDIKEFFDNKKSRYLIITIPSRKSGNYFSFHGLPLMRVGEELTAMDQITLQGILAESEPDWTSKVCKEATLDHLNPEAILVARDGYKTKNPNIASDVDSWSDEEFLINSRIITTKGITNTAIILLGNRESQYLLLPMVAEISWILKGDDGEEKDYEHFSGAFILSTQQIYNKIRNLKYRYIKDDTLFPEEVNMYDPWVIREVLHNCIAHQDYSLCSRIQVVENEDGYLIFSNKGSFAPGSISNVIRAESPQEFYKNKHLVSAMVNVNMVDTIGSGIKKIFNIQKKRFFPMPTYNLEDDKVEVKIFGKVLNMQYARILAKNTRLSLEEIIALDAIQKKQKVTKQASDALRKKGYIEGRYPNIFISEEVAIHTGNKAQYIKDRGLGNDMYKQFILEYIKKYPGASREQLNDLMIGKFSEVLSESQQKKKVGNLLNFLSTSQKIENKGTQRYSKWFLST